MRFPRPWSKPSTRCRSNPFEPLAHFESLEVRTHLSYTASAADRLIALDQFRADPRFSDIDGTGYAAVIIDDGIDRDHPFFGPDANNNGIADRIIYSYDYAGNDSNAEATSPHGSNVTSIVGSSGNVHRGMAPGVNLIHLKVFKDKARYTKWTDVERALKWVISNAQRYNIVSVNMSLGEGNYRNAPPAQWHGIADELAALAARDVIVSAAAGNSFGDNGSRQGLSYPAADPNVLAVGAVFERAFGRYFGGSTSSASRTGPDRITPFSQRSTSQWMIFAPGSPIKGAGLKGKVAVQNGTSQASPHVAGVVVLMQQLADQILGRRLKLGELRALMKNSGRKIVDGDDERDVVRNTGATFRRLDVMNLAEAIWRKAGPEIELLYGKTELTSDTSSVSFGTTPQSLSLEKSFAVTNAGVKPLLISSLNVPAGFSIVSNIRPGPIAPGDTATFTLRLNGAASGAYRGEVQLISNDTDESNFRFTVTGTVNASTAVSDDGASTFSSEGAWTVGQGGYTNDHRSAALSDEEAVFADWTFANLIPGRYRIWTTWTPAADLSPNANYLLIDGAGGLQERIINQRRAPDDLTFSGVTWESLGELDLTGTELIVSLDGTYTGQGTPVGRIVADAVRIERLGPIAGTAIAYITFGATQVINDGLPINLGSTTSGRPTTKTITIRNVGGEDLLLGDLLEIPEGFSIVGSHASLVPAGASTTLQISLEAGRPGDYEGSFVLQTSNPDEPEFRINVAGKVAPTTRTIDNGETGFVATGSWTSSTSGYRRDSLSALGDGLSTASWAFTRLTPGVYRVLMSWAGGTTIDPTLAANAPVSIATGDGSSTTHTIDQRYGPDGELISSAWWNQIVEFRVVADVGATTGTLLVTLGGIADGRVIADGVRIERIDN